jgi:hypothetical protein
MIITPPMQKNLLYKLNLPIDILIYVEEYLVTEITRNKIERVFWQTYNIKNESNDNVKKVLNAFKYIKKYGNNIEINFDEFNEFVPEFDPINDKTFGNFFITFFYNYLNCPKEAHEEFINFIEHNIIMIKGIDFLSDQKMLLAEIDVRFYHVYSFIDILFGIVFSPEYLINKIKINIERNKTFVHDLITKNQHNNTKQYFNLLNNLVFSRVHEVFIDEDNSWYINVKYDNDIVCTWKIDSILDILCYWKDNSLYSYISNIMKKIKNNSELKEYKNKYLFRQILNNNGYLLLDALLCGSEDIIAYYEKSIIKIIVENNDTELFKKLIKYKNIKKFLLSPIFQFKLITIRKFKIVKWFFKKYKNIMKILRNDKGENLLEVACMSRGLNQNIIKLFLDSGLFTLNDVRFRNRKVKKLFDI